MKNVAAAALLLSGLMPLGMAVTTLAVPSAGLAALGVTSSSADALRLAALFAVSLLLAAAVQLQAAWWIARDRPGGLALGRLLGVMLVVDGGVMVAALPDPSFGIVDAAKGLVVLALVIAADRRVRNTG